MPVILDAITTLDFPLSGHQLIEASAGTGKTYTLANLYLRHVLAGRTAGELLVVTFTEAATEELRGRIRARLHQTACLLRTGPQQSDPQQTDQRRRSEKDPFLVALLQRLDSADDPEQARTEALERLQLAVHSMDEAAIQTIHGFCRRMLSEFAFLSGQGFQFDIIADDAELRRQYTRDWWRVSFYRDTDLALRALLQQTLGSVDAFLERLDPLLGLDPPTLLPTAPDWDAIEQAWQAIAQQSQTIIEDWRQRGAALQTRLLACGSYRANAAYRKGLEGRLLQIDQQLREQQRLPDGKLLKTLFQSEILGAQKKAKDPALNDPLFERCEQLAGQLGGLQTRLLQWALADAAAMVRNRLNTLKQDLQQLSHDDLLGHLHQALVADQGPLLARAIQARYPVAMIDEFQDTDPTQYAIFHAIYQEAVDSAWTLIGDPKQAIYSFRGGDIFTYARAKRDIGPEGLYSLDTNWRSVPAVVEACNRLFSRRPDAFIYSEAIPFEPIKAADKDHQPLMEQGREQGRQQSGEGPGMVFWRLLGEQAPKAIPKSQAMPAINRAVAAEIARLIEGGRRGETRVGERPLCPGDIAVLVRTHHEADDLRAELQHWGISAVTVGNQSVFSSAEALALLPLLQAVAAPADPRAAMNALASALLGIDYAAIHQRSHDDQAWGAWRATLAELQQQWIRHGFMAMFQAMIQGLDIAGSLAAGADGERRITNLLQLGELAQQASKAHPGIDALLHWYLEQLQQPQGEERELRLESDAELVQLVTIHKSKGLEYPVVFVPYLWSCRPRDPKQGVKFHQHERPALDIGSEQQEQHLFLAEKERLAEDLRLLYVAVTRARLRCYLVWGTLGGGAGNYTRTALGYLLLNTQDPQELDSELPDAAPKGSSAGHIVASLEGLAADAVLQVTDLPEVSEQQRRPLVPDDRQPGFAERRFTRGIADDWRVESFTALARELPGHSARPGLPEPDPALNFARGSQAGSFLHALLELIDFQQPLAGQLQALLPGIGPRYGFAPTAVLQQTLCDWLQRVFDTPLDQQDLRLAGIGPGQRLNELAFDFATNRVDIGALDRLLSDLAGRSLPGLGADDFQGVVTGIIDLVFAHQGRYYLADYKSNYLGPDWGDYSQRLLQQAMLEHRYDLQYLLYSLALHRYLGTRLRDYDYQQHFGGAYYLFLRGMRPQTGASHGIWFHKPDFQTIERLEREIFRTG